MTREGPVDSHGTRGACGQSWYERGLWTVMIQQGHVDSHDGKGACGQS